MYLLNIIIDFNISKYYFLLILYDKYKNLNNENNENKNRCVN